jgi:MFS family permease
LCANYTLIMIEQMPMRKAGTIQAIVIILINLLPMMAVVALLPVGPAIRENFKDVPYIMTLAPLILSAPGLCVALFSPYVGHLTDKLGRRKLLIIFTLLYGIGGVLPFFMTNFSLLMGGRLILGIGEAFVLTIGNTLYGDYYSSSERSKWLMIQGIVGSGCGTLLYMLSGYLVKNHGWQYPFLVYGFTFFITILTYIFIFEPTLKSTNSERNLEKSDGEFPVKTVVKLCITTLIASVIYFVYTFNFSFALDSLGVKDGQDIGNYMAAASIAVPIGALIFKFFAKYPIKIQLTIIAVLIGVGMVGIGTFKDVNLFFASAFIQQLGCGMTMPVLIAWGLNSLPAEFRGRGMGFWSSAFFLGQFISPLAVSFVRNLTGSFVNAFFVFGIMCLGLALINFVADNSKLQTEI